MASLLTTMKKLTTTLLRTMETANRFHSAGWRIGMTGRVSNSRSKKPLASGERLLALIPQKLNCHSE